MTTMTHNRFDEAHRDTCDACFDAYIDFTYEQADEERLDSLAENEEEV